MDDNKNNNKNDNKDDYGRVNYENPSNSRYSTSGFN